MQNSYVKYNGNHRVTYKDQESEYLSHMFADDKHRRLYIGPDFDIPNHWFKFTGCEFESTTKLQNMYYFSGVNDQDKTVFHEYWDNCKLTNNAAKDFFRFKCINTIPAGVTIRNSYLKYDISDEDMESTNIDIGAPFRFQCGQENCNCLTENTCSKKQLGKHFPFVHYENNVLDRFIYPHATTDWEYHINTYESDNHNFTIPEAVVLSGSYVSGVYWMINGFFSEMKDLDRSGPK